MEKVQILLSVYRPKNEYLIKQLKSINSQDYPSIELIVFDDGASIEACDREIFKKYITRFPYKFLPNEEHNLGYIASFEKLIKSSDANYLAFCDQDDIWENNKISRSIDVLNKEQSLLVASDKKIIDENDKVKIESVRKVSKRSYENWKSGDDICKSNLFICYAPGMSIVVNGDFARKSLPLSKYTGHDKWLLSCASTEGTVSFINETLVRYRRHSNNVSGVLIGINSKEDYVLKRVMEREYILNDFFNKYPNHKDKKEIIAYLNAQKEHNFFDLYKYRYISPEISKFEMLLCLIPNFLFSVLLKIIRKMR